LEERFPAGASSRFRFQKQSSVSAIFLFRKTVASSAGQSAGRTPAKNVVGKATEGEELFEQLFDFAAGWVSIVGG
jgi:hypothetical protein